MHCSKLSCLHSLCVHIQLPPLRGFHQRKAAIGSVKLGAALNSCPLFANERRPSLLPLSSTGGGLVAGGHRAKVAKPLLGLEGACVTSPNWVPTPGGFLLGSRSPCRKKASHSHSDQPPAPKATRIRLVWPGRAAFTLSEGVLPGEGHRNCVTGLFVRKSQSFTVPLAWAEATADRASLTSPS